jgi:Carboxypeptidase regulatory-like domain
MRHSALCAFGLLLAVVWPATKPIQSQSAPIQVQQPPRDRPPVIKVGTAALRGRVVDAGTGAALARVRVRPQGAAGPIPPILTDGEGAFAFANLPAGGYVLSADKSTYMTTRYPEPGRLIRAGRQPLTLRDGESRDDVVIRMFHGGVLAGRVLDAHGDPVEYADVRVFRVPRSGRATMFGGQQTNALGEFRVPRLDAGRYMLFVQPRRLGEEPVPEHELPPQPVPTYYPGVLSVDHAQRIVLERGQTIAGLELTLGEGRHTVISGLVISTDGQPLGTNVSIGSRQSLDFVSGYSSGFGGTGVRPDGSFRMQLPPGEFVIEARTMQQPKPGEPYRPENERLGSVRLSVGANPTENIVIQVGPGATASGRVVFDGAAPPAQVPAQVHLPIFSPEGGCRPGTVKLASDWTFKVEGLYGLCQPPPQSMFGQWTLKSVLFRGRDLLEGPMTFEAGQAFTDVQVVFTNRRTELEWRVTDERAEPTREYVALVFPADKDKWKDLSRTLRTYVPPPANLTQTVPPPAGGRGNFSGVVVSSGMVMGQWSGPSMQPRIMGLPMGEYYIVAVDDIESEDARDPAILERLIPSALRVTLTDTAKTEVDLRRVMLSDVIR